MMKPIEALLPRVMVRVNGAAEPMVIDALRMAAQQFCEATRLWRYEDSFDTMASQDEVMCVPNGAEIFEIESARFNGIPLEPVALSWLESHVPLWRELDNGGAKYITQAAPDTLILVPRGTGTLSLGLTLKPSDEAEQLPDWLINKYSAALADGAIGELMIMPGQPFTNPNLASVYIQRFNAHLGRLSNQSIKGQQRAPARTMPQYF